MSTIDNERNEVGRLGHLRAALVPSSAVLDARGGRNFCNSLRRLGLWSKCKFCFCRRLSWMLAGGSKCCSCSCFCRRLSWMLAGVESLQLQWQWQLQLQLQLQLFLSSATEVSTFGLCFGGPGTSTRTGTGRRVLGAYFNLSRRWLAGVALDVARRPVPVCVYWGLTSTWADVDLAGVVLAVVGVSEEACCLLTRRSAHGTCTESAYSRGPNWSDLE